MSAHCSEIPDSEIPTRRRFSISSLLASLGPSAFAFLKAAWNRRHLTRITDMDDRMLRDIGLTYEDVVRARMTGVLEDPTKKLRLASQKNIKDHWIETRAKNHNSN